MIRAEAHLPMVREVAARVSLPCGPVDAACRVRRLGRWVGDHLRFLPDPVGVEAVASPALHIARIQREGSSFGDCDDAAALAGCLARAVGSAVRLVVVSVRPDKKLHHIFAQGAGAAGQWIDMDPFLTERRGAAFTRVVPFMV